LSNQGGTIPSAWKQSNITPVHKGGSCNDPGNFCGPCYSKLLEKLITIIPGEYLEDHGLLHHQGGFNLRMNNIIKYKITALNSSLLLQLLSGI